MRNFPADRPRRGAGPDTDSNGANSRPAPRPSLPRLHLRNPIELLRQGVKLQLGEAEELREMLIDAILTYSDGLDGFISQTNADRAEAEIWSTITREDAATIANPIVEAGKKYAQIAFLARQIGRSYLLVKIGVITIPRFFETMGFYAQHGGFLLWSRPPAPVPAS